jgi:hypothetical protein
MSYERPGSRRMVILCKNIAIGRLSIPLWVILLIMSIVVIAVAVPASWILLAKGTITVKAAPAGVIVQVVSPSGGDFGSITIGAGQSAELGLAFNVYVVDDRPYEIEGIYIGYKPQPPRIFDITTHNCRIRYDGHVEYCEDHEYGAYNATLYTEENGWTYYKYSLVVAAAPITLSPGNYTHFFKMSLRLEPIYSSQDLSFDFKIYINFRKV